MIALKRGKLKVLFFFSKKVNAKNIATTTLNTFKLIPTLNFTVAGISSIVKSTMGNAYFTFFMVKNVSTQNIMLTIKYTFIEINIR